MKQCNKCNEIKELDQFNFRKDLNCYRNQCKLCRKNQASVLYAKDRNIILLNRKENRLKNIEKFKLKDKLYNQNNKEKIKERKRTYLENNKEKIHEKDNKKYQNNKEVILQKRKLYHAKTRPARLEYRKKYCKENRGICNALQTTRRLAKIQRTPPWLTKEHKCDIKNIYIECAQITKKTGIKHVVDHIIPLRGETVCGLHVPWNLQILTHEQNSEKSNKLLQQFKEIK